MLSSSVCSGVAEGLKKRAAFRKEISPKRAQTVSWRAGSLSATATPVCTEGIANELKLSQDQNRRDWKSVRLLEYRYVNSSPTFEIWRPATHVIWSESV